MSSSEPILDLKGDTVEALPENLGGTGEQSSCPPRDTPGRGQTLEHTEAAALQDAAEPRQDRAAPGNAAGPPGPEEPSPGRDAQEVTDPSPTKSPPWPEAPEECPARPCTLDWHSSPRKLQEGRQPGTDRAAVTENGLEATPATATSMATASSEEHRALQSELGKCIEEFRRIRIPAAFPNKKRQWQSELLRKYQL